MSFLVAAAVGVGVFTTVAWTAITVIRIVDGWSHVDSR